MKPLTSVNVQEISAAGPVTQDENVKVSAILVEHPPVKPALAYRFDFKDRSIAFSGDTAPLETRASFKTCGLMTASALIITIHFPIARSTTSSSMCAQ
jgi:ribonuclease BN (tRNA processing enzyme)